MTDLSSKLSSKFTLQLDDSRRLTGANLLGDFTGAIMDVSISNIDADVVVKAWEKHAKQLLERIGWDWHKEKCFHLVFEGGASLAVTAPIDALYTATDINEAAWELTRKELFQIRSDNFMVELGNLINRLQAAVESEQNPALIALQQRAKKENVVFLSDDDEASIGYGKHCQIYPIDKIPNPDDINWQQARRIPVAIVTGTNGKSTTVRLADSVAKAANKSCGITSTDYIRVGEKILDTGDYSGPGGARMLLRHPDTEVAFLEVARGGLLRRGIGINQASAVAITNVAKDHLGQYGINTLADMVETKFIVRQAINEQQALILNADDAGCVDFARSLLQHPQQSHNIVWFSWSHDNPLIQQHIENDGTVCYIEDDTLYYHTAKIKTAIISVSDIPITLNGAAKHNIHNALTVVALCFSLGFKQQHIAKGLKQFSISPDDNPGRGNLFELNGYQAIVDFAHNEHGLKVMAETIKNMPAKRRLIMLGQAGDRSDSAIQDAVKAAINAQPNVLILCEVDCYLRGRKAGELSKLMQQTAMQQGMKAEQIILVKSSVEGAKKALEWAQADDLLLLITLDSRDEIIKLLS